MTVSVLMGKGYDPLAYRYFLLNAHYRQQLAFTFDALDGAASAYKRLKRAVLELRPSYSGGEAPIPQHVDRFREAAEDDLNMPRCLAAMWDTINDADAEKASIYATLLEMDKVLGLGMAEMVEDAAAMADDDVAEIEKLIIERKEARAAKDFARSDEIRDDLAARGIILEDGPEGTTWHKA